MNEDMHAIVDSLQQRFGAQPSEFRGEVRLVVAADKIIETCRVLRDEFGFKFLAHITAVDYWPEDNPRFHVIYNLVCSEDGRRILLRVPVAGSAAQLPTLEKIFINANWYEREVFDMFGVRFEGHSDLRRIIMPFDWVGHPLRKDYPLGYEEVQFSFNHEDIQKRKPQPQD